MSSVDTWKKGRRFVGKNVTNVLALIQTFKDNLKINNRWVGELKIATPWEISWADLGSLCEIRSDLREPEIDLTT